MTKIRWSNEERQALLTEVRRQHDMHRTMSTLDIVRMAQRIALPTERRRELAGTQQVEWVQRERDTWPFEMPRVEKVEVGPMETIPPKPDLVSQLVELLSDAMVQVVAEAVVRARQKLDLPTTLFESSYPAAPKKSALKKVVIYGLLGSQESDVRKVLNGCFEFRFLKDTSQEKMVSGAQWADYFIIMTKFVSHDYEAIKRYGNIRYNNGAVSSLIAELEVLYLEQTKEPL